MGDIIGYKYEFTAHDYAEAKTEELPPEPARFSDDTALSIATMKAVLLNPENPDFRQAYIDAYHQFPMAGYGGAFTSWALNDTDNTKGYHSFGNGCAMRISFIPAYYDDIHDVIKHTIAATMPTHDHTEAIKGAVVIAVSIWMALHNYSKETIYEYCREHYNYTEDERKMLLYEWCQFDLNCELSSLSNEASKCTLFANNAVPYAIKCFYDTNSYEECMREILSHFGDTDTVCAIAGGLCYAYYGTTGFETDKILSQKSVQI